MCVYHIFLGCVVNNYVGLCPLQHDKGGFLYQAQSNVVHHGYQTVCPPMIFLHRKQSLRSPYVSDTIDLVPV
jgi:hypothetical protein